MYYDGLYNGVKYYTCPYGIDGVDNILDDLVGDGLQSNVVGISMIPTAFVRDMPLDIYQELPAHPTPPPPLRFGVQRPTTIDGYVPRNNKLFTFPYCYIAVDCINDARNYRFEYFNGSQSEVMFSAYLSISPAPEVVIAPRRYNGSPTDNHWESTFSGFVTDENFTESLTMTGFPQCAYVIDSYRAWLAQKATGQGLGAMASAAGTVLAASLAATPLAAVAIGVAGVAGLGQQINQMHIDATQHTKVRGNVGGDTLTGIRRKKIYFKIMTVSREYAQIIDEYFDKFGYACCRIKTPNRNVRLHWTYTKTKNIDLRGAVPTAAMDKIKECYNNGIRFWKSFNEVGNYTLTNSVLDEV